MYFQFIFFQIYINGVEEVRLGKTCDCVIPIVKMPFNYILYFKFIFLKIVLKIFLKIVLNIFLKIYINIVCGGSTAGENL